MRSSLDILARILNRLKLLELFNLTVPLTFNGTRLKIPVRKANGFVHLYTYKDLDFDVYDFFRKEIGEGVFLDVGANIGQTLLRVVSILPGQKVVCVEPASSCVAYLEELKLLNDLRTVTILPAAIFGENGIQKLYSLHENHTGASLSNEYRPSYYGEEKFVLVNSITGGEMAKSVRGRVSFIKIDVEGTELEVMKTLRELITRDQPAIFCEVLDAHNESSLALNDRMKHELEDFLRGISYRIWRLDRAAKKLVEVDKFPNRIYSPENYDNCNYIFKK